MKGIKSTREFNGKKYSFRATASTRSNANEIADFIRSKGINARVLKFANGYIVYRQND